MELKLSYYYNQELTVVTCCGGLPTGALCGAGAGSGAEATTGVPASIVTGTCSLMSTWTLDDEENPVVKCCSMFFKAANISCASVSIVMTNFLMLIDPILIFNSFLSSGAQGENRTHYKEFCRLLPDQLASCAFAFTYHERTNLGSSHL